jgi:glycosyltransferase involved in cell wall biosynthesis
MAMKIAFFAPHFSIGGLEKTNLRLSEEFQKLGHKVELITFNYDATLVGLTKVPIKIHDLDVTRSIDCLPPLVRVLREENYGAVISCQHYANVILVLAVLIAKIRVKILACERISIKVALDSETGLKKLIMPGLLRFSYRFCHAVIANSAQNAEDIKNFIGNTKKKPKVMSIYNPARRPEIPEMAREECSEMNGLDGKIVFVSVGRLSPEKNITQLLSAFAELKNIRENVFLVIVGDGPSIGELREQAQRSGISDCTMFVGYQTNPYRFMARSNVFVLTSEYEGLPNVLIEAQVLNLPIISTDCMTGPREILLDGRLGDLTRVGSVDELIEAMTAAAQDLRVIQGKSDEARNFLFRFDPEESAKSYLKLVGA